MKNPLFLLFTFLAISIASKAQYFRITNDSILAKSELILENATKGKTGAFIRNKGNGRTDYAYAVDSGYIQNNILYLHRGDGWIQIELPTPATLPGDGNNYVNLLSYFNDVLTIGRNGLANITANIPLSSKVNVTDTAGMLAIYKKAFVKGFYNPLNNSLVMTRVNGTDTIIQQATAGWGLKYANGKFSVDTSILSGSLLEKDSIFLRSAASTITGNQIRAWDTTFRDGHFDSTNRILWLLRNYHYDPPRGITTDSLGIHFPSEKIDTTSLSRRIDAAMKYSDTASALSPYLRGALAAATYQPIGNYPTVAQLNLKVNISDTAGMLGPYLPRATATATYEPKISPGTTAQYWRGDKTWQPFPTIPAQFNPIAGTGVSLSGTFPNITFNSTATGGVTTEVDPLSVHVSDSAAMLSNYLKAATAAALYEAKIAAGTTLQYWRGDKTWQTLTIPAQFNPIAGTGVTLSGTYPNITFNSTATGGGGGITGGSIVWPGTIYSTPTTGTVSGSNITFSPTLASQSAYTVFGRGSGSGTPSFLASLDSNWIPSLHTQAYYDGRYAAIGSGAGGTTGWGLLGNSALPGSQTGSFLGTTNNVSLRFRVNNVEKMILDTSSVLRLVSTTINMGNTTVTGSSRNDILVYDGGTTGTRAGFGRDAGSISIFGSGGYYIYFGAGQDASTMSTANAYGYFDGSGMFYAKNGVTMSAGKKISLDNGYGTIYKNNGGIVIEPYNVDAAEPFKVYQSYGGVVGIGNNSGGPIQTAQLMVNSTTKGFLPPRMTTTQRDAISSPEEGLEIYNLTTHAKEFYNGTVWKTITTN